MTEASQSRYSTVAMLFHWVIAILVIVNWRIAEGAEHLEGAEKAAAIAPHMALRDRLVAALAELPTVRIVSPPGGELASPIVALSPLAGPNYAQLATVLKEKYGLVTSAKGAVRGVRGGRECGTCVAA